ncbi:hypothetical protein ATANTOWER_005465 [Ataeniobius toweri]|uniref:Uncharacterized protein n=1 Tax=Ataeniobius toweri TaxID=208326 RepID=A0ABU7BTA9_9TELE|nr:hypothetical protein [Ataeniobius toweri]
MLGVLLHSLVQLPAVLADFYLSGLLEEGKLDPDLGSDDDERHAFTQVTGRVSPPVSANSTELSSPTGSSTHPFYSYLTPHLPAGTATLRLHNFLHNHPGSGQGICVRRAPI